MVGTRAGWQKAQATILEKYGPNFYKEIGRKGGKKSSGGYFKGNPEVARLCGKKGGRISLKGYKLIKKEDGGVFVYQSKEGEIMRKKLDEN